jgi:hypothetical protein
MYGMTTIVMDRFVSKYFEKDIQSGVPTLTQTGRKVLEEEIKYEDEGGVGGEQDGSAPASASYNLD